MNNFLSFLLILLAISGHCANLAAKIVPKEDLCSPEWWKKATPEMFLKSLGNRKLESLPCHSNTSYVGYAASWGHPETIKVFLEKGGANFVNSSLHGWTPLRMAIQYQSDDNVIAVVRLLVKYGANLSHTPFGSVVDSRMPPQAGHSVWYEVLSRWSQRKLSLRTKIVEVLLELGANTRGPSPGNGVTSIGLAIRESPFPLVELMIRATPDFRWSEICGLKSNPRTRLNTCIFYAMENWDTKVVDKALKQIKKEGFSVSNFPANTQKNTLLHHAAVLGNGDTIKKLIHMGADKTALNNQGWTASKRLEWRLKRGFATGKASGVSYNNLQLLKMMEISLPLTEKFKNFFKNLFD